MKRQFKIFFSALALILFFLNACTSKNEFKKTMTIGTTAGDFYDLANEGLKADLEKKGIRLILLNLRTM